MQAEFPRPGEPADNNAKPSSIESFLWATVPIVLMIVLAYLFWP